MEIPEQLSGARLLELVEKVRTGNASKEDMEELAGGHIRLAMHIASLYATYAPHMKEVFQAEAFYGIALALSRAPKKLYDNNITPFIVRYMRKFVYTALTEDRTVPVPNSTIRDRAKRGLDTALPKVIRSEESIATMPDTLFELKELITSMVKDQFEKEVLWLRELGLKDVEISQLMECSRSTITATRKAIYQRYCDFMEKE